MLIERVFVTFRFSLIQPPRVHITSRGRKRHPFVQLANLACAWNVNHFLPASVDRSDLLTVMVNQRSSCWAATPIGRPLASSALFPAG